MITTTSAILTNLSSRLATLDPGPDHDLIEHTIAEIKALTKRVALLSALEAGGVDNWKWYHESTKHLYREEDE